MPKYSVASSNFTTSTAQKTQISLTMGADEFAEVVYLNMTGSGTAAAADIQSRAAAFFCDFTTAGTVGTSPTPELMIYGSRIAGAEADIDYTAEPTNINTVALVSAGFNSRGGFFWAVPQGEGIRIQGGLTEDGLVWTVDSQAAAATDAHVHWWE